MPPPASSASTVATEHCNKSVEQNVIESLILLLSAAAKNYAREFTQFDVNLEVTAAVVKWSAPRSNCIDFGKAEMDCHNKLISIIRGYQNDNAADFSEFLSWARRVQDIRETVLNRSRTVAEHAGVIDTTAAGTATKHATAPLFLSAETVTECYERIGTDMLWNDLLPKQKKDKRYKLTSKADGSVTLSGFHRSFIDNMLRRNLGSGKVATYIWKHGLPLLFDGEWVTRDVTSDLLQSHLDKCLQWWTMLIKGISDYEGKPGPNVQRDLPSSEMQCGQWLVGELQKMN